MEIASDANFWNTLISFSMQYRNTQNLDIKLSWTASLLCVFYLLMMIHLFISVPHK